MFGSSEPGSPKQASMIFPVFAALHSVYPPNPKPLIVVSIFFSIVPIHIYVYIYIIIYHLKFH